MSTQTHIPDHPSIDRDKVKANPSAYCPRCFSGDRGWTSGWFSGVRGGPCNPEWHER